MFQRCHTEMDAGKLLGGAPGHRGLDEDAGGTEGRCGTESISFERADSFPAAGKNMVMGQGPEEKDNHQQQPQAAETGPGEGFHGFNNG